MADALLHAGLISTFDVVLKKENRLAATKTSGTPSLAKKIQLAAMETSYEPSLAKKISYSEPNLKVTVAAGIRRDAKCVHVPCIGDGDFEQLH
jgi:hypothetical protein